MPSTHGLGLGFLLDVTYKCQSCTAQSKSFLHVLEVFQCRHCIQFNDHTPPTKIMVFFLLQCKDHLLMLLLLLHTNYTMMFRSSHSLACNILQQKSFQDIMRRRIYLSDDDDVTPNQCIAIVTFWGIDWPPAWQVSCVHRSTNSLLNLSLVLSECWHSGATGKFSLALFRLSSFKTKKKSNVVQIQIYILLFVFIVKRYLSTDFLSLKSDCMVVTVPEQTCWSKQSSFHWLVPLKHHISCFRQTHAQGRGAKCALLETNVQEFLLQRPYSGHQLILICVRFGTILTMVNVGSRHQNDSGIQGLLFVI